MLNCPAPVYVPQASARRAWERSWTQWTGRRLNATTAPPLDHCLGAVVPSLARQWIEDLHQRGHATADIDAAAATAWSIIRAVIPHRLWLLRNATAFRNDPALPPIAIALQTWSTARAQIRSIATADQARPITDRHGRCLARLLDLLDEPLEITEVPQRRVRLYYDGGSRGNPGPSGSGSVIIEQDDDHSPWRSVWWDSHFVGSHYTNNFAEHTGLARGLTECARRYGSSSQHIDVVGDSLLVTRQFRNEATITASLFQTPVAHTRQALHRLFSYDFHHVLRAGNKMADWLANHAMDTKATTTASTTTHLEIDTALSERITNDVQHAFSQLRAPATTHRRLLDQLTQLLDHHLPATKRSQRDRPIPPSLPKRPRQST